jgi:hypothetical protein
MRQNRQHGEKNEAFKEGLIKLAGVPRQVAAARENHTPPDVGHASEQFGVDEVCDAAEEKSDRHGAADKIREGERVDLALPAIEEDRDDHARRAAME